MSRAVEKWRKRGVSTEDLIETVCKKCRYYQKGCLFDYGDSLTKIPCEALIQLARRIKETKKK